ncbi:hypothetical protein ACFZAG_20685 [Streptomyces sp. NPDC012403]|uniref:hypothetical protein n=1 Tax=unclassified Streptomyces TaxID=2593676 RepID=UPI0036F0E6FD
MRKFQKAAVVAAMLGSVGFLGAGVSHAGEDPHVKLDNKQSTSCSQDEDNSNVGLNVLNNVLNDNAIAVGALGGFAEASADSALECNAVFGLGR